MLFSAIRPRNFSGDTLITRRPQVQILSPQPNCRRFLRKTAVFLCIWGGFGGEMFGVILRMIAAIAADPDCDPDGTVLAFLGSPSNATKNNLKLIFLFYRK